MKTKQALKVLSLESVMTICSVSISPMTQNADKITVVIGSAELERKTA